MDINWELIRQLSRIGNLEIPHGVARHLSEDDAKTINNRVATAILILEPVIDIFLIAQQRYLDESK